MRLIPMAGYTLWDKKRSSDIREQLSIFNINNKANKLQRTCGTISRTLKGKTQLSTQIKFYKVMAVPVLMYGSENWSLNISDKRKTEAAKMRF